MRSGVLCYIWREIRAVYVHIWLCCFVLFCVGLGCVGLCWFLVFFYVVYCMKSGSLIPRPYVLSTGLSLMLFHSSAGYFSHNVGLGGGLGGLGGLSGLSVGTGLGLTSPSMSPTKSIGSLADRDSLGLFGSREHLSEMSEMSGDLGGFGGFGDSGKRNRKSALPLYSPKSVVQQIYVSYLQNPKLPLVLALGPAGCGKTLFACVEAMSQLQSGAIQKIVITRPLVSVEDEEIGFLPGNMVSKMDPWTRPMMDIFREFYSMADLQNMIRNGVIEIVPLAFMRGRTFHRTFVIADEMQNSSPNQMMMLTTRLGLESKMVVLGDLQQSDRDRDGGRDGVDRDGVDRNGLDDFVVRYENFRKVGESAVGADSVNGAHGVDGNLGYTKSLIGLVRLSASDVFRSQIVSFVLDVYNSTLGFVGIGHSDGLSDGEPVGLELSSTKACSENDFEVLSPVSKIQQNYIPLRDCGRPYPN